MKVIVIAEVPDELAQKLVQYIRDFDTANTGCKFRLIANAPDKSVEELKEMLEVSPPLAFKKVIKHERQ